MNEEIFVKILFLLVFVGFVTLLIAGATNKIVIYFDIKDFLISLAPSGTILLTFILVAIFNEESANGFTRGVQYVILFAGVLTAAGFIVKSIRLSILHNRSVGIGVIVGLFKVLAALLGTFAIYAQIARMTSKKSTVGDVVSAAIWVSILMWLGKKLINGEQVYIAKGWNLADYKNKIRPVSG